MADRWIGAANAYAHAGPYADGASGPGTRAGRRSAGVSLSRVISNRPVLAPNVCGRASLALVRRQHRDQPSGVIRLASPAAPTTRTAAPDQLAKAAAHVERHLAGVLDEEANSGTPDRLIDAMRHGVLNGGKRFRPFLVITCAGLFGIEPHRALGAAASIELIHCYSLVHDDLPAMDNDRLRRGRPTVWAAFDDWTAILVGDALQSLAFSVIGRDDSLAPEIRVELIAALADASGARGMVGGQVLDLEAEKRGGSRQPMRADEIARLQGMKTGRLISVACDMGAILAGADASDRAALKIYGDALGLAFQISDDLLDVEGSAEAVGKATGKDADAGKATLVSLLGPADARAALDQATGTAIAAVGRFGEAAQPLVEAARFLGRRKS
jgi:farnesyl diphosphate synthase